MKKQRRAQYLLMLIIILLASATGLSAQFAGGSGTEEDPYQIATAEHLNSIRNYLDSHFIQIADIDLNVAPFNQDGGWVPIGTYIDDYDPANIPFSGSYNGNGNIIQNLMINEPTYIGAAGLFGYAVQANFSNIQVTNCQVSGNYLIGCLLGYGINDSLNNCQASGSVSAIGGPVGGLAGECHYVDVIDCFSTADISTNGINIGGLIGWGARSNIDRCYATGNVNGSSDVGGLCGHLDLCYVTNCFAGGAVSGFIKVGGLVGR
jgi:hypothetical protein